MVSHREQADSPLSDISMKKILPEILPGNMNLLFLLISASLDDLYRIIFLRTTVMSQN